MNQNAGVHDRGNNAQNQRIQQNLHQRYPPHIQQKNGEQQQHYKPVYVCEHGEYKPPERGFRRICDDLPAAHVAIVGVDPAAKAFTGRPFGLIPQHT